MVRSRSVCALVVSIFALSTVHCASQPFATGATADAEYDFPSVKSLAFAEVPKKMLDSANGKILRAALEESLTARGFEMVEPDDADLWVSYDLGIFTASSVSWGDQGPGQGRIVVRAIDPKSGREVWYGWAEAHLRLTPDPEKRIRQAVEALFESRVRSRSAS